MTGAEATDPGNYAHDVDVPEPRTDEAAPSDPAPEPAQAHTAQPRVPQPDTAPEPAGATDAAHRPEVLEALEADLAAVEEALATLDRITADGGDGAAAAAQVAAVVSVERFPDPDPDPDPTPATTPTTAGTTPTTTA